MSDAKISVQGLWKVFGHRVNEAIREAERGAARGDILARTRATVALRDVTLDIPPGRTFIVMGLSGSGKSTLVRCINRLVEPTRGRVLVDGTDITTMDAAALRQQRRRRFGMVFQHFALLPHRTVADNVALGLELQGVPRDERAAAAARTLQVVGLEGWSESYPDQLSGGMQQRVGLARALVGDPDILLMDEPFSALDPLLRTQLQDELLDLQVRLRKTILFITHDLDEALKLGATIAILSDGEISQVGTADDILRHPADDYVAAFVEKVDRSRILAARDVMSRPRALVRPGHSPEVALRLMEQEGRSASFVVGADGRLEGLLTADAALEAARRGDKDVRAAVTAEVCTVGPDEPLSSLIQTAADQPYPLAVLDHGQFVGIVARVSILRGLAEHRIAERREIPATG